ncbi:MAG TPA: ThiF family adenylyltransferase [Kineosporiaceae bacterium]|nr:ThiF family adenylyltransferase [Kineosporiaceae bacterium]
MSLPPLVEPGPPLRPVEVERYARHLILPDVGPLGQRRLAAARVLVVGAGGLGSPALLYLAAAGVGTIGIADADVVDVSNLQRQVVHTEADVGRPKVASARDRVLATNPHVRVRTHRERLTADNAVQVIRDYDLVLDGADNFPTRYLVDDACALLGKPDVWGSILAFDGQVGVFWAPHGPTYRELFPAPPPPGTVADCATGGVLGALCATVGSVMATEAVKLICGIGEPLVGRLLVVDALGAAWRTVAVRPPADRVPVTELIDYEAFCGVAPASAVAAEHEIDVHALAGLLGARERGEADFVLVDVREPYEREIVAVPGAVGVPLARIEAEPEAALAEQGADGRRVVLMCKSGARSARALATLRAAGRQDAVHVAGGVLAWVREIEPDKPLY